MNRICFYGLFMAVCGTSAGCTGVYRATATTEAAAITVGQGSVAQPSVVRAAAAFSSSETWSIFNPPLLVADVDKNGGDKNGEEEESEKRKHIRDNGFLVEEAFNQEKGEVQHIFNWINLWDHFGSIRTRDFLANYTMELPLGSQKHQFSFTAQFLTAHERIAGGPGIQDGDIGDTFLNYRYQLLANDDILWCAPRASLILPTGDRDLGTGTGEVGYQFNLPISRYGDNFDFHFNAGYTLIPNVSIPLAATPAILSPRHDLSAYNLGGSAYWKPKQDFHLFVETLAVWADGIDDLGSRVSTTQVFLNPGFRFAVIQDPVEWVLGFSAPIGLTRDTPDIGFFAYMSIEHTFRKKKNGE